MKTVLLFSLFVLIVCHLSAQHESDMNGKSKDAGYSATAGSGFYRFPEFATGMVYFKNGTRRTAKLNYNYRHGQVEFIDGRQDTLLLTGKYMMDRVEVNQSVFYVSEENGDLEQIGKYGDVVLAQKTRPEPTGDKLPYSGQKFVASSSVHPSSLFIVANGGGVQWQNNSLGESYKLKTSYYLIDGNRVYHQASKPAFLKIYGKYKPELRDYFRDRKVDFRDPQHLGRLLGFCNVLAGPSTKTSY